MLAVVLCGAVMISYAQQTDNTSPKPAWAGHRHGDHMGYMAKALNLTDAQKAQIKSMMQANRTSHASADAANGAEPSGHADGHFRRRF